MEEGEWNGQESEVQEAWINWHLLGMAGPLHTRQLTHFHRIKPACSGQGLTSSQPSWGGYWQLMASGEQDVSFLEEPGPWRMNQPAADGPTPMSIWAAQTGLFKTNAQKNMRLGGRGRCGPGRSWGVWGNTIKTHLCMYKILKEFIKIHSIKKFSSLNHKDLKKHFFRLNHKAILVS